MQKPSFKKVRIDYRFLTGLGVLIFFILVQVYAKPLPIALYIIPALLMGVDLKPVIDIIRAYKK